MKRLLLALAVLGLVACPPASASPPLGFRLGVDTVKITSSPCTVSAPTVSCRVQISTDSTFATVLSTQTVAAGQTISGLSLTCPAPLATVTLFARAYGVNASGTLSSTFASDRQTIQCPDQPASPPNGFRLFVQVIGG